MATGNTENDKQSFISSFGAWREVRQLVDVSRGRLWWLAALGAAVGLAETVFLAILASVGVALAGKESVTIKLPIGDLSGVSIPALLGIGAAAAAATLAAQFLIVVGMARINSETVAQLRKDTYRDFVATSWATQRSEMEGTFLSYVINYTPRVSSVVTSVVGELTAAITLLVFLGAAVLIAPTIAGIVIVLGTALFAVFLPIRRWARKAGREATAATRVLYTSFVDAVAASREIKTYGVEKPVSDRIGEEIDALEAPTYRARLLQGLVPAIYIRVVFVILLGGLGVVYALDIKEFSSIGAAMLLVLRAMQQAQIIQGQEQSISESRPWISELQSRRRRFTDTVLVTGDAELEGVDEIEFDNISYSYPNGALALDAVSFTARRGELIGLIGPSGSGKSTLSELAVRLDRPSEGAIRVNGRDFIDFSHESWTRNVVLVPQLSQLIGASVEENIRFLREGITTEHVVDAATRSHLIDEIGDFEDGFATEIGERGHRGLSGGQRQRLSIARAIVSRPSLVVLDEPTSALDHRAEEVIVQTIEELREHACVIVIAHRLSTLRHCDRVLVLRDGKREAFCALPELALQSEFYRAAGPTGEF